MKTKTFAATTAVALSLLFGQHKIIGGDAPVPLGTAGGFAVLAGAGVTSTRETIVNGDVGSSPATATPGFPPGVVNGSIHAGDNAAAQAEADLTVAYNDAAGRMVNPLHLQLAGNIGGETLTPGVYKSSSSLAISSGDLTLDAGGDPNAVFIFQIASTLTVTSGRRMILSGGANSANVFWQVGSSATLGTASVFKGNILALQSITLANQATLEGRALARVGAVTMDANSVTLPSSQPSRPRFGPISRAANGIVILVITNTPGRSLTLQSSINLSDWTDLSTTTPNVSPYVTSDSTDPSDPKRFYRGFYP